MFTFPRPKRSITELGVRAFIGLALTAAAPTLSVVAPARADGPIAAVSSSRSLEALWYRDGEAGQPRTHGVTRIRATVSPNHDPGVRIGIFEEYAGATGAQWRTSIWVASFIASVVTGSDLTGLEGGGTSTAATLMRLQSAASSYVESASVITKYYSLDAVVADEGRDAKVRRQRALSALLKRAESASREAAAVAEARLGVIPPDARFHYRSAVEQLAHGTVRARLRALTEFWRSTVESRTAAMVLQRVTPLKPPASQRRQRRTTHSRNPPFYPSNEALHEPFSR